MFGNTLIKRTFPIHRTAYATAVANVGSSVSSNSYVMAPVYSPLTWRNPLYSIQSAVHKRTQGDNGVLFGAHSTPAQIIQPNYSNMSLLPRAQYFRATAFPDMREQTQHTSVTRPPLTGDQVVAIKKSRAIGKTVYGGYYIDSPEARANAAIAPVSTKNVNTSTIANQVRHAKVRVRRHGGAAPRKKGAY